MPTVFVFNLSDKRAHMKDTKARILEAAEKIIAEYGADKATLRMITSSAKVNLAAINYHFGSKDKLLDELFASYIKPMEDERIRRLDEAETTAGEGGPGLETIIRCYLKPFLDFVEKYPDHNHIFYQLHRPYNSWKRFIWQHQSLVQPVLARFFDALSQALPEVPRETLLSRMVFMQASISWLLNNYWILWEFKTLFHLSLTKQDLLEELVSYTTAGFRGGVSESHIIGRAGEKRRD
jgi:AcrR family transcriptional regulator